MRDFDDIFAIAAARHGGPAALNAALNAALTQPMEPAALAATGDDRWLATLAKCVFQAGFSWKVIESKWPGFETAFEGFDPGRVALYADAETDRLLADKGIIRNGAKIAAVIENAAFLRELAAEHGSAARAFADWPPEDHAGLLAMLARRGARLGGTTGQRALRMMGKDGYVLSPDVVARLAAESVVEKAPTSKKAMAAVQAAFDAWRAQSGRSLTEISQVLARSIDA